MKPTIVTGYWDLEGRGLKVLHHDFMKLCNRVLDLDCPMVVYRDCGEDIGELFEASRWDKNDYTSIKILPFEKTPAMQRWGERAAKCKLPGGYERSTYHYQLLCYNKALLLGEVARQNPFNTEFFYWLDIVKDGVDGIEIAATVPEDGRMHFHVRRHLEHVTERADYYDWVWARVAGGYWGGSALDVIRFEQEFIAETDSVIESGRVAVDEDIYARIIARDMPSYALSFGDYKDIFTNRDKITTGRDHLTWILNEAIREKAMHTANGIMRSWENGREHSL